MTSGNPPACRMDVWSSSTHLSQLYAGFSLLAAGGEIRLTQQQVPPPTAPPDTPRHLRDAHHAHMAVQFDGKFNLYFDTHDSYEIQADALQRCDLYFKRSFAPAKLSAAERAKVLPLGLNYEVYAGAGNRHELFRDTHLPDHNGKVVSPLRYALASGAAFVGLGRRRRNYRYLSMPPAPDAEPRVLFMTRTWDPAEIAGASADKLEERVALNELRAACILRLRRELGKAFSGGLQHTEHARRHYPEALLDDDRLSERNRYIGLMREFPICVATTGLHGSIGWKLAEYTAFSKAIAAEPLCYVVPGDFGEGRNYTTFASADACVQSVVELMDDAAKRAAQMENNWRYFRAFVRPDALVRYALAEARARLG